MIAAASSGVGRRARLGEPERDGERDEPLLGAVVEVALEHAARLVGSFDDARARCPDLLVLAPALGDVDAREEHERRLAPRHVVDRRRRPRDHDVIAVGLPPPRLPLDARHAVRRGRDRHPREVAVVGVDQVEHARSHDLAVRPTERLAERVVDAGARRFDAAVDDVRLAVDDHDDARDRLHQRARDVALALQLDLALLALRHVTTADEEEAPLVDGRQEDARPRHRQAPPALRHPRVVVVADGLAGCDTLDQLPHRRRLLRRDVVVPEHGAGRLVRLHLELALERLVGASGLDHPVLVDQQEEARRLVRDRVQELALALAGRSLLVARRDVDAARDDPPGPAVLVRKRGRAPEHDAALAAAVDESVLVLDGRVDRSGCLEARDHVRSLPLVDEDVPELAAADRLLAVLAGCLDRGDVLVHDRPFQCRGG